MEHRPHFFRSALDSLPQHIAVISATGDILWVNRAWRRFSEDNDGSPEHTCVAANYLDACERAARAGDAAAADVAFGFQQVMNRQAPSFSFEYPCNCETAVRWFLMRLQPIAEDLFVVSHENITERKILEDTNRELAQVDPLTGLANRRQLESFLKSEIKRAQRASQPVTLMMVDVDNFKRFNDRYGHPRGDECLQSIGRTLLGVAKRPGDLAARYGGEEFAVLLLQTSRPHARRLAEQLVQSVRNLAIPHHDNPPRRLVTASVGVAVIVPDERTRNEDVVSLADRALYAAKAGGRDRLVLADHHVAAVA